MKLDHLSDAEVLTKLDGVIGSRRRVTAALVAYLGEVEVRRLERKEAYSSMYDFCCRKLKLSEGSAHRHIAASRVARSYPMALTLLREGRLHVTALSMLQTYLDEENHAELLSEVCDKSKAEIERLIRSRHPRPDVLDTIRALPAQTAVSGESGRGISAGQRIDVAAATERPREPQPRVSPLSAGRFHVQFTAGSELKAKLERALNLTSHQNPKRALATLIEKSLDLLLADIEKKKLGKTNKPRPSKGTKNGNFSREARREIYERDGEQCAYVSPSGQRCQAQAFLEMDHRTARARGGRGTSRNGRVLCAAHNALEAENVFGREFMESRIRIRQRRLDRESSPAPQQSDITDASAHNECGQESVESAIHLRQQRFDGESSSAPQQSNVTDTSARDEQGESMENGIHLHPRHQRRLDNESSDASVAEHHIDICEASAIRAVPGQASSRTHARHLDSRRDDADAASLRGTRTLRPDEMEARLLCALTTMGFRRGESKKALATLTLLPSADENVARFKTLLRQALAVLVPRRTYC